MQTKITRNDFYDLSPSSNLYTEASRLIREEYGLIHFSLPFTEHGENATDVSPFNVALECYIPWFV